MFQHRDLLGYGAGSPIDIDELRSTLAVQIDPYGPINVTRVVIAAPASQFQIAVIAITWRCNKAELRLILSVMHHLSPNGPVIHSTLP
jgi:hypothetical protein